MASREVEKARRRAKHDLKRTPPYRKVLPSILIVCEGENTEPSYFNAFKFKSAKIEAVGEGYNTTSLIDRTIALAPKGLYDEVWCVFDKDAFPDGKFNSAITKAKSNGFNVAYSNQAFEYWILLHFSDHQGNALPRGRYNSAINQVIQPFGVSYDGNGCKKVTPNLFRLMCSKDDIHRKPRYELAIERARRIYNRFDHASPAQEESSTTVFQLVEHLLEYELA